VRALTRCVSGVRAFYLTRSGCQKNDLTFEASSIAFKM
jgi:hypothetical protein